MVESWRERLLQNVWVSSLGAAPADVPERNYGRDTGSNFEILEVILQNVRNIDP